MLTYSFPPRLLIRLNIRELNCIVNDQNIKDLTLSKKNKKQIKKTVFRPRIQIAITFESVELQKSNWASMSIRILICTHFYRRVKTVLNYLIKGYSKKSVSLSRLRREVRFFAWCSACVIWHIWGIFRYCKFLTIFAEFCGNFWKTKIWS